MRAIDVVALDGHSVVVLTPLSAEAKEWFAENVRQDGRRALGPAEGVALPG
jgi:hypothetical protein